ncbi:MFS transporter [Pedobacter sp. KBW06]|uniref:MFS transporter n=1 Tax=Pedobacter sp. KBW06 TaxID=2153359 RepID=UPI0013152620|nr:MFS transporter [Pedobacter sp. KBW06]
MPREKFPFLLLLAFTMVAFSAIITELLPAGVLPDMANDLQVRESSIGRLVSYYALGTVLTAFPATALTSGFSRKPLLITVIFGFFLSNAITALSQNYLLTVVMRVLAGGFSGVLWPLMTGYAARLVNEKNMGKAISMVMAGSTIALSVGLPIGAFLGQVIGWRGAFAGLSALIFMLIVWIAWKIPDFKADEKKINIPVKIFRMPGVPLVMTTTFTASLAVYVAYTYLSPIMVTNGIKDNAGLALGLFGMGAVPGILITARFIDTHMRSMLLSSILLGASVLFIISLAGHFYFVFYTCIVFWGISFGGLPSLLQTATINATNGLPEIGSSITVTVYNIGVFSGAFIGGLVLDYKGPDAISWTSFLLMVIVILLVVTGRRFAFPSR